MQYKHRVPLTLDKHFAPYEPPVPVHAPAPVLRYMDIALIAALAFVVVALIS